MEGKERKEGRKERGGEVKAIGRRGEGMGGEVKGGKEGTGKGPQSEKNDLRHRMAGFGHVYAPNF